MASTQTNGDIVRAKRVYPRPEDGAVRVSGIFIHPLKSCRGLPVESANYNAEGLEFDRKWCILDINANRILTAHKFPKLVLIAPRIDFDPTAPHKGFIHVIFPEDSVTPSFSIPLEPSEDILSTWECLENITLWPGYDLVDGYIGQSLTGAPDAPSTILSQYIGKPVHLIFKSPRVRKVVGTPNFPDLKGAIWYQDLYPMMILSQESMEEVEAETKSRIGLQGISESWREDNIDIRRFRPNVVLSGGGSFAEDNWEEVKIGSQDAPCILLVSKCARCLFPNVSPDTGEVDKAVPFKVLMKFRTGLDPTNKLNACAGCYAMPEREGVLRVGDGVYVQKMWDE